MRFTVCDMLHFTGCGQKTLQPWDDCKNHIPCLFLFVRKREWHILKPHDPSGSLRNLDRKDEDYWGDGVKGHSKGQFSEAFVTFRRVPLGNTYCTLNFRGCRGKKMCPSDLLQSADILECLQREKNVECVKSIFQRHFRLYLSCTVESTGYPVSEAPAHKIKNASCLHPYEVLYRNRPHSSSPPVLSKMVLE